MASSRSSSGDRRRVRDLRRRRQELQLQTLYDLLIALHSHGSEQELVDEITQRACAVVDPAAALVLTRTVDGQAAASCAVGWKGPVPDVSQLREEGLLRELFAEATPIQRFEGEVAGHDFHELQAWPLVYRGEVLGCLAVSDKEHRGAEPVGFSDDDRRFLASLATLSAVTLDGLRQVASLRDKSARLEEENKLLRRQWAHEVRGQRFIAKAESMRRIVDIVQRVAPRNVNLLIRGESGTGKELIAGLLHQASEREGPMVAVNCAALPESLLESELFGIERGVATGVSARVGKFELAHRGTLFLDEIGDLDISFQVKLLRALQEREVTRVGGLRPIPLDVRVVSATHRDLETRVEQGSFRQDLYYRLKGVELEVPPLRERREEIPHLVSYFVARFCKKEQIAEPRLTSAALALLVGRDYPGNVRELQSLVEGAVALADGEISVELLTSLTSSPEPGGPQALDLKSIQQAHVRRVLEMTGGNKTAAAKLLRVDRRTLSRQGF